MAYGQDEYDPDAESSRRARERILTEQLGTGIHQTATAQPGPNPPAGPAPSPTTPAGGGASTSSGGGGSSRDDALRRVQSAYQQYLPNQMGEVDSATDELLRRASGYDGYTVDRAYGDLEAQLKQRAGNTPGAGASPYTSSGSGGGSAGAGNGGALRDILMKLLEDSQRPVSVDDPGVRDVLAGQRLFSQRSAEREQRAAAERLAAGGLVDSGAADTTRLGIAQARGEADARFTGDILANEMNDRRRALMAGLGLGFQDDHFLDTMGFQYAGLQQNANLQALLAMLGAV